MSSWKSLLALLPLAFDIQLSGAWGVDVADLPQDGDLGASLSTGQASWVERLGTSKMWNSGGDLLGSWLWLQGAMAAKLKELQKETGRETVAPLLVYSGTLLWFMRHFSRRRPPGNQLRVVSWHLFNFLLVIPCNQGELTVSLLIIIHWWEVCTAWYLVRFQKPVVEGLWPSLLSRILSIVRMGHRR